MIPIKAHYIGEQERPGKPPIRLYNPLFDIPGHPGTAHSSMSLETLHNMGYEPQEEAS
jgi:hypothetical protein